jgi:stage II sporulation protein D
MKRFWKVQIPSSRPPGQPLAKWPAWLVKRGPWTVVNRPRAKRLTVAGGLFFTGMLITHATTSPASFFSTPGQWQPLEPQLWQTEGSIRQSIADLYRARRFFLGQVTAQSSAAQTAEQPTSAAGDNEGQTSQPATSQVSAASTNTGSSPSTTNGETSTSASSLPRPVAPPAPSQPVADFDPAKTIDTNLEMRVAVAKNVSTIEVATSVDGYVIDLSGQNYCNLPAQTSYTLQPRSGGMGFGDCQLSEAAWLEPGEGGYIYINGRWFKGRVLLLAEGNSLMAVNFVLLYDYLSSVVGSEMYVNWPLEALKAQAVAARSYALTHHVRHANRAYDLDNTQRYQAYLGIAKETNTTQAAVAATAGEFISHNGGIVESLYAASDDIVQTAHGGNGMSQTGAMQLASQGYGYAEILVNYYPNTSLSRLVVN